MKLIPIQEAYQRKFERQSTLKELSSEYKLDISGYCARVGAISQGCVGCFIDSPAWSVRLGAGTSQPSLCQCNCPYCFESDEAWYRNQPAISDDWELSADMRRTILGYFLKCDKLFAHTVYSFTGSEGMLYLPVVKEYMKVFRGDVDKMLGCRGFAKIYTNGLLLTTDKIAKLKDYGIDEVRVHLGASNFSKTVYKNIEAAIHHLPVVSVETPAWPPHRKKLFEMLPILEDIGVQHLNLGQVEIDNNRHMIDKALPTAEIYQTNGYFLDDGGLVEEIIKDVILNKYSYSVIDCNAFVHQRLNSTTQRKDPLLSDQSSLGESLVGSK